MEYVTLNSGVKMPMAGIGTFLLTPDEAENSVAHALKDGYRLIDTANAYVNEKAVGRAIRKSGVDRSEIFLETKLWPSFYEQEDAVDKTLERLDTDYIDLLLIHQPAGNYVAGYRLMEKAYKEGKVKAIGLSNFNKEQIQEILDICEVKPAVLQTEVHPYDQEKELKEFLAKADIVIQAWYPLGHGDEPPTYACVGASDGIASYRSMEDYISRIQDNGTNAEIEVFDGLRHGFGLGEGTVAEGWIDRTVSFWEQKRTVACPFFDAVASEATKNEYNTI